MRTDEGPAEHSEELPPAQWCEQLANHWAPDLLAVVDPGLTAVWTNEAVTRVLGYPHRAMWGTPILEFVHPEDLVHALGAVSEASRNDGYHVATRMRVRHADRTYVDTRVTATTVDRDDGTWFVLSVRPVADEEAIESRRRRLRDLANTFYVQCASMEWADEASSTTGLLAQLGEVLAADSVELCEVSAGEAEATVVASWDQVLRGRSERIGVAEPAPDLEEVRALPCLVDVSGSCTEVLAWLTTQGEGGGFVRLLFGELGDEWDDANADIVSLMCSSLLATVGRCTRERAVALAATTDPLTGLLNRLSLHDRLAELMSREGRGAEPLAVFFADLNNFKHLNDTQGHQAGDAALRAVGEALAGTVRAEDLAARVGGDEFVVVMSARRQSLFRLSDRLRGALVEAVRPWPDIGVALGSISVRSGDTPDEVLKRADLAMYEDKRGNSRGSESVGAGLPGGSSGLGTLMSSLSPVVVVDADVGIVMATNAAQALFGLGPGALRSRDVLDLVHPAERDLAEEWIEAVLERVVDVDPIHLRVTDVEGKWHWTSISASNQLSNPEIEGIVLTLSEDSPAFSPRGPGDLAIALGLAVDALDGAVVVTDADQWVAYASRPAEQLLGYGPGELVGLRDVDLVVSNDREMVKEKVDRRRLGVAEDYELKMLLADGGSTTVRARVAPVQSVEGSYLGSIGIFTPLPDTVSAVDLCPDDKE